MTNRFRILSRDANLSAAERAALGLAEADPRDTLMVVEVFENSPSGGSRVLLQFNHIYQRSLVNKRQLAAQIRAAAQTQLDLLELPDAGGEAAMVYDPARLVDDGNGNMVPSPGPEFDV